MLARNPEHFNCVHYSSLKIVPLSANYSTEYAYSVLTRHTVLAGAVRIARNLYFGAAATQGFSALIFELSGRTR